MKAGSLPVLVAVAVALAAGSFVVWNVAAAGRIPDGPVALAWDRAICVHCRMHVGEPAFAVQAHTEAGEVLAFDDPGCAFEWLAANAANAHRVWFHHLREDRWLAEDAVAFVRVPQSPMGFGWGAVDRDSPDAVPLAEARAAMLEGR